MKMPKPAFLWTIPHLWSVLMLWGGVVVIGGVLCFIHLQHIFTFQSLQCQVNTDPCPDYVEAELRKHIGRFVLSPLISQTVHRITQQVPSLGMGNIHYQLPQTIIISFEAAKPKYLIRTASNVALPKVVDTSGLILTEVSDSYLYAELPQVIVPQEIFATLDVRTQLDAELNTALVQLLNTLQEENLQPTKIEMTSIQELQLELSDGIQAKLSFVDTAVAVRKLAAVLKAKESFALKEPVREIDVRFKYPIVKTVSP